MTAATQLVRLADVELEVVVRGPEAGPAVILLHGFPETALMWDGLATVLASEGYRTIAPNQRGYGQSSSPRGVKEYDVESLSADVRELALALGHESYSVVGHDWGAAVGWWLASHPDGSLTRLVAISAPHPAIWRQAMEDDREQRRMSRYVRFFQIPWLPEMLIRLTGYAGFERADAGASEVACAVYRRSWRTGGNLSAMLNWYRALMRKQFTAQIEVAQTTLFIYGQEDRFLSEFAAQRMAAIGTGVETVPLEGGHWLVAQRAAEVRRLVLNFLERRTLVGAGYAP